MCRVQRVLCALLFTTLVSLAAAGCSAPDLFVFPRVLQNATMTHEERGKLEDEKWEREYRRLDEARKAQEAAATKKVAPAQPAK